MTIFEQLRAYAPVNAQEASDRRLILQYAEQFGNLFTRENEMAHLTASCWIVNPARTKALLAYHNIYDSWAWLGGHADGMEDLLAVACKEANEESGVTAVPVSPEIFSVEILGVAGHVKRGKYVSAHLHLNVTYLLQADEAQALHEKPDENSGVRWFALRDVVQRAGDARGLSEADGQVRCFAFVMKKPLRTGMVRSGFIFQSGSSFESACVK